MFYTMQRWLTCMHENQLIFPLNLSLRVLIYSRIREWKRAMARRWRLHIQLLPNLTHLYYTLLWTYQEVCRMHKEHFPTCFHLPLPWQKITAWLYITSNLNNTSVNKWSSTVDFAPNEAWKSFLAYTNGDVPYARLMTVYYSRSQLFLPDRRHWVC